MEHENTENTIKDLAQFEFLKSASTDELRALVREKIKKNSDMRIAPTVVVGMRKSECIDFLVHDNPPMDARYSGPEIEHGNGKSKSTDAATLLKQAIEALGIESKSKSGLDEERVLEIVNLRIAESAKSQVQVTHLEIKQGEKVTTIRDAQHRLFPIIMGLLAVQDINVCLTGPAGSGKTACLKYAASTLDISLYLCPMNIMTTKSDLGGYMNATGEYVPSSFYLAFKNGGLYVADEFDSINAGMGTWLNAAIANRAMTFANNETVYAHKDFRFCACMNTTGQGATMQYVGRNALDAATLDRFVMLDFQYDNSLEFNCCGIKAPQCYEELDKGGVCTDLKLLVEFVQELRVYAAQNKYKATISPRASIAACKLTQAGFGLHWICESVIFKGLSEEQKNTVKSNFSICMEALTIKNK